MRLADGDYAIFIDIDGTLLGSKEEAFAKNIDTIQVLRDKGHKFFISTGRGTAFLTENLNVNENFDGVISGAGAVSKFGKKELFKNLMPLRLTEIFCKFVLENNLPGVLEGQHNMYYFEALEDIFNVNEKNFVKVNSDNIKNVITPDVPIEKFTIMGEIPKELDEALGDECLVIRHPSYGEIIQKNCGKGKALLETIDVLGIPVERSIAIGDSMNDYDMLEAAGIAVAMGNASEEIKKIADIVTDDVDSAGVATALIRIFSL